MLTILIWCFQMLCLGLRLHCLKSRPIFKFVFFLFHVPELCLDTNTQQHRCAQHLLMHTLEWTSEDTNQHYYQQLPKDLDLYMFQSMWLLAVVTCLRMLKVYL